jgi:hypothetical protein|tara:strand:- start:36 stop:221 length:186 start_codon:yes stop_codon:yes gene_type:complete
MSKINQNGTTKKNRPSIKQKLKYVQNRLQWYDLFTDYVYNYNKTVWNNATEFADEMMDDAD